MTEEFVMQHVAEYPQFEGDQPIEITKVSYIRNLITCNVDLKCLRLQNHYSRISESGI